MKNGGQMSRDATAANNVYMPLCYRSDVYYFSNTTSYTQTLWVMAFGQAHGKFKTGAKNKRTKTAGREKEEALDS